MKLKHMGMVLAALIMIASCKQSEKQNKTVSADVQNVSAATGQTGEVQFLSDADFDSKVINTKGVTLVDFFATWCPPCKMQGPIIENLAKKYSGKASMCKVDVDKNPQKSSMYGVRSIPTLILFKDGQKVEEMVGLQSEKSLIEKIDKQLAK